MGPFADRILEDLRSFLHEALEPGLAATRRQRLARGSDGLSGLLLRTVSRFASLIPPALEEVEEDAEGLHEDRPTRRPHRARLSTRQGDYEWVDGRPSPSVWLATEVLPTPPVEPLRFLLHLEGLLREALEVALRRHLRVVRVLHEAREGGEGWTRHDLPPLEARWRELRSAALALEHARLAVRRTAPVSLRARTRMHLPHPYPRGRAWEMLRQLLPAIREPWGTPLQRAQHLLGGYADLPDLPFLYQRWCTLAVHEALVVLGYEPRADVARTLFAAGEIPYEGPLSNLSLWIEPRLVAGERHPSGFTCIQGREVTPDLLLVTPGPDQPDAFVLDPTLATRDEALSEKGSYLHRIASHDLPLVAGVPVVRRRPVRAWAIAPLRAPYNRILDDGEREGRRGAIPLHPLRGDRAALEAFLGDVSRHATAWSRL